MSDFEPPDPREPDDRREAQSFWDDDPPSPDEPPEFDPVWEGIERAAQLRRLRDEFPVAPIEHVPAFVPLALAVVGLVGLASASLFDNGAALSAVSVFAGVVTLAFSADLGRDHFRERSARRWRAEARMAWGRDVVRHAGELFVVSKFVEHPVLLKRWARLVGELSDFATYEREYETAEQLSYARALMLDQLQTPEGRVTRDSSS